MKIKNALRSFLLRFPAIFIMAVSWYLSSKERLMMPDFENSDKFVHFICFGGLAFAWTFWFSPKKWSRKPVEFLLAVVAIVSAYGIIDELHQSFVPGRSCSIFDWMADTSGAFLAGIFRLLVNPLLCRLHFLDFSDFAAGKSSEK